MSQENKQKKRERKYWEREFLTHEFDNEGIWVPKEWEQIEKELVKKKKAEKNFAPPGALTPAQVRRSTINGLRALSTRRAIARWKKKWRYVEPIDLTKAFTE